MKKILSIFMGLSLSCNTIFCTEIQEPEIIVFPDLTQQESTDPVDDLIQRIPQTKQEILSKKIPCKNIRFYAKQFAKKCSNPANGRTNISYQHTTEPIIDKLCELLGINLRQHDLDSINQSQLDFILKIALSKVIPSENIPLGDLTEAVEESIKDCFEKHSAKLSEIPKEMRQEFGDRKKACINKLRKNGSIRLNMILSQEEVDKIVCNAFDGFIERMNHINLSHWIEEELKQLDKQDDDIKIASSALISSPESKKLKKLVKFPEKKK